MPKTKGRRGGRPSRLEAAQLQDKILDVATGLFLTQGFGATSIEAVVARAGISKRTFYHRFRDKEKLFESVVRRLLARWMGPENTHFPDDRPIEETLQRAADRTLAIALSPEALALHRVIVAEAQRFPELAQALNESGAMKGIESFAALLEREAAAGRLKVDDSRFAAEQFLNMVLSVPRRRALGLGEPMSPKELRRWARRSVDLFLHGCRGSA